MSANLDQSLDEIIGKRSNRSTHQRRNAGPKRATKQVNVQRRTPGGRVPGGRHSVPRNVRAPANAVSRVARMLNNSGSVKVNVEGLPRDIKQDAVREFFATHVGGVQGVLLSYNERGLSTGMANITFRNGDLAKKAVAKFNGAPIDNGKSRLRLNMIVSAAAAQSNQDLSSRIQALPARGQVPRNVRAPNPRSNAPRNVVPRRNNENNGPNVRGPNRKTALAKKQNKRKAKPAKKSLEDLDKEMADYFEEKN